MPVSVVNEYVVDASTLAKVGNTNYCEKPTFLQSLQLNSGGMLLLELCSFILCLGFSAGIFKGRKQLFILVRPCMHNSDRLGG